ncbi:MAG: hypothetical protein HRT35_09010 [Algicola sp.]|nr:hypothetical protein [Algicola sp.]
MPSLNQATKVQGKDVYRFGGDPIPIIDAPDDTDWKRWGMLNDRKSNRLYFFKSDTDNTIYPFLYIDGAYRYDDNIAELTLSGITDNMDTSSISMLCTPNFEEVEGFRDQGTKKYLPMPNNYHVYMQQKDKPQTIHQILWEEGTRNLKLNGITSDQFDITGFPQDTDWSRWAITYDSNRYQLAFRSYVFFAFKLGSYTQIYYGRHGDKDENDVSVYGYKGIIELVGAPADTDHSSMSIMFDGVHAHLYMLTE